MKKKKFNWKGYYEPTPKLFRKVGDSLMIAGSMISGAAIYNDNDIVAMICLYVGVFGKFMTNFFTDER